MMSKWSLALFTFYANVQLMAAVTLTVNPGAEAMSPGVGTFNTGTMIGDLRGALNYINTLGSAPADPTFNIVFSSSGTITLNAMLPVINLFSANTVNMNTSSPQTITIDGNASVNNGLFTRQGNVTLNGMTIQNCRATGGNGGAKGGGAAMGAGGGLFNDSATVTLTNMAFTNCSAVGGNAGSSSITSTGGTGGGGGMFKGTGGDGGAAPGGSGGGPGGGGGGGMGGSGGTGGANSTDGLAGGSGGGGGIGGNGGNGGNGVTATGIGRPGGGGGVGIGSNGGAGVSGSGGMGSNGTSAGSIGAIPVGGGGGGGGTTTGGTGGGSSMVATGTGGSGGGGNGSTGNNTGGTNGGAGGNGGGGGGAGLVLIGGAGGIGGGGGGGTANGKYGGGGGGGNSGSDGGLGNFGGGGGGIGFSGPSTGGASTYGGGGGGGLQISLGGAGGFGGSGGGGQGGTAGASGVGAGTSSVGAGGGAGMGGAIFWGGPTPGGNLIIGGGVTISGSNATGGTGANTGGTSGKGICCALNSTITFNPSASTTITISDPIGDASDNSLPSGMGFTAGSGVGAALSKTGGGTLILAGANTYKGATTISGGILSVTGTLDGATTPSAVTVASGGTLKGTGTIAGSVTVQSGGTIQPGTSVGTLTVGTLSLNSGSTTVIEVNPSTYSKIAVTGTTAIVDGTLQIVVNPGTYTQTLAIVSAPSATITGTFNVITDSDPNTDFVLTYSAHEILLGPSIPTPTITSLSTAGLSSNNIALVNQFNQVSGFFSTAGGLALTRLSGAALENALNSISPVRTASTTNAILNTNFNMMQPVASHMRNYRLRHREELTSSNEISQSELVAGALSKWLYSQNRADNDAVCPEPELFYYVPECNNYAIWGSAFAQIAHQNQIQSNPAYHFNSEGGMVGFDYLNLQNTLIGGAIGGMYLDFDQSQDAGDATTGIFFASIYANWSYQGFYLEPALLGGYTHLKNRRHIFFPGFDATAKATIPSWQLVPHLEFGYDFEIATCDCYENLFLLLEPFATVDWAINWQNSYTETGAAPFNFTQESKTSSLLRSEAGLKFYQELFYCWGIFGFEERGSYVNKTPFWADTASVAVIGAPSFISLSTFQEMQNLASVGCSLIARWGCNKDYAVDLSYQGEFGSGWISNQIYAKFSKGF